MLWAQSEFKQFNHFGQIITRFKFFYLQMFLKRIKIVALVQRGFINAAGGAASARELRPLLGLTGGLNCSVGLSHSSLPINH